MSEWKDVPLVSVCDFHIGGTPSRETPAFWSDSTAGLPWLAISDLQTKYVGATSEYISHLGANSSNVKRIPEGTTVMSFKLSIGRTAITTRPMYCNEAIAFFEPKAGAVDAAWLYHALPSATGRVVTDIAVKGATLNKKKIAEIPLRLPPRSEQSAIARILDTLDTQIEKTQALIAKLEQVKEGLLHDLLTRGVDENGELRPSAEEAPELYKASALGRIPKGWEASSTTAYLRDQDGIKPGPFGSSLKKESYTRTGFKVYGQEQVIAGDQSIGDYFISAAINPAIK